MFYDFIESFFYSQHWQIDRKHHKHAVIQKIAGAALLCY